MTTTPATLRTGPGTRPPAPHRWHAAAASRRCRWGLLRLRLWLLLLLLLLLLLMARLLLVLVRLLLLLLLLLELVPLLLVLTPSAQQHLAPAPRPRPRRQRCPHCPPWFSASQSTALTPWATTPQPRCPWWTLLTFCAAVLRAPRRECWAGGRTSRGLRPGACWAARLSAWRPLRPAQCPPGAGRS